jgi:hypothetical protein
MKIVWTFPWDVDVQIKTRKPTGVPVVIAMTKDLVLRSPDACPNAQISSRTKKRTRIRSRKNAAIVLSVARRDAKISSDATRIKPMDNNARPKFQMAQIDNSHSDLGWVVVACMDCEDLTILNAYCLITIILVQIMKASVRMTANSVAYRNVERIFMNLILTS